MIDILYIKGKVSPNDDLELRYSLRSLQNVVDKGRVFITGNRPDFVKNVVHTPCDDIGCRTINHWWKVRETILKTDISDDFILMYDDIFFMKGITLGDFPFYNRGLIKDHKTGTSSYIQNLKEAQKILTKMGKTTIDYTLHIPCIYNRDNFLKMDDIYFSYIDKYPAPSVRCMYGNLFVGNSPFREDLKIRNKNYNIDDIFSTADETFKYVLPLLKKEFPERCKYENSILY